MMTATDAAHPLRRWDGRPVWPAPALSAATRAQIEALTKADRLIYDAAGAMLDAKIAALEATGVDVRGEVAALRAEREREHRS